MIYTLSIDWLSMFCLMDTPSSMWEGVTGDGVHVIDALPWKYKTEEFGTRQYRQLTRVYYPNAAGGFDDFAEVQSDPYSTLLNPKSVIVRFCNRTLYLPNFWELATNFLHDNGFRVNNISRVDICADFNQFASIAPLALIRGFASTVYRHVGRGVGALYFNHGILKSSTAQGKDYGVQYTGLSFGTHSSDARVYLYNKSFELKTQGDKPYIRDRWTQVGLNVQSVWRLEISLKSKACEFKDKTFHQKVKINFPTVHNDEHLDMIYHTFVRKLFAFVKNRPDIKNITREPRIKLFDAGPWMERGCIRNVSGSSRLEKIVIKALWTMSDKYRGEDIADAGDTAKAFAGYVANATDLTQWLQDHANEWQVFSHK